jgi:lysine 2,3-aminomutase
VSDDISDGHENTADKSRNAVKNSSWSDWRWQLSNRITSPQGVSRVTGKLDKLDLEAGQVAKVYPMAITPYYLSLIDWDNPRCPIRLQCIPDPLELKFSGQVCEDPLAEEQYSPVTGLIHRYPDRVLLLVTLECSTYCRHCTRKRKVGDLKKKITMEVIRKGIDYIRSNSQIRDVLLSGGDPLILEDQILEAIIGEIREIPHVEVIRIGSRVPVVMPQRITESLASMLKKYHPLWLNTHFNHPLEFTAESDRALAVLAGAGIPLGNQTVLLKGINDDAEIIKRLVHLLVKNRVRPYYLYHCDSSRGVQHFRTSIQKGIEIQQRLIGFTSGFAVPTYVADVAGGGGKIPLGPQYVLQDSDAEMVLKNFEGRMFSIGKPDYR